MSEPKAPQFVDAYELLAIDRFKFIGSYAQLMRMVRLGTVPHWRRGFPPAKNGGRRPRAKVMFPVELMDAMFAGEQVHPAWFNGQTPSEAERAAPRDEAA